MRKELLFYTLLIAAVALLIFVQSRYGLGRGNENYTRIIDLEPAGKLHIDLDFPVYVSKGDDARIAIEGPSNIVDAVILVWHDGELTITMKPPDLFSRLTPAFLQTRENISIYLRLPRPSVIEAPCTAHIISAEPIPGLDSCRDATSAQKVTGTRMKTKSLLFSKIVHVLESFGWGDWFHMDFNMK